MTFPKLELQNEAGTQTTVSCADVKNWAKEMAETLKYSTSANTIKVRKELLRVSEADKK